MTAPVELREFVGTAFDLAKLHTRFDVVEVDRLIDTFPWWKRALAWSLWRTPLKRLWQSRFHSPYGTVRAMLRPRSDDSATADERVRTQAAAVLAHDSVSCERPVPRVPSRDGESK